MGKFTVLGGGEEVSNVKGKEHLLLRILAGRSEYVVQGRFFQGIFHVLFVCRLCFYEC